MAMCTITYIPKYQLVHVIDRITNIPLKNKPTIKYHFPQENHNHKNQIQQKWQKATNQPTGLFFTGKRSC